MDAFKKIQLQEKLNYYNELHEFKKFILTHEDWQEIYLLACFKKLFIYDDTFVKHKDKFKMSKDLLLGIINELIKANDKELDELVEGEK